MDVMLMGPPGVGKGTQAGALAAWFGLVHLASGDLLRENVRDGTALGRQAHTFMRRGELVPDRIVIDMVLARMLAPDQPGTLLDGFPRTLAQARELTTRLAEHARGIDAVALLTAPRDVLLERITGRLTCAGCGAAYHVRSRPPGCVGRCDECGGELRGRDDDNEQTARRRLNVYTRQTAPLADHYAGLGLLVEVDADADPETVAARLVAALAARGLRSSVGDRR